MIHCKRLRIVVRPTVLWLGLALALSAWPLHAESEADARQVASSTATPKNVDELLMIQREVQAVVGKAVPTTVGIRIGSSQGSGVIVSPDGYVLTAGHVIGRPGLSATVILSSGRVVHGKTLGIFGTPDAGLVKIDGNGPWPSVDRGHCRDLAVGTWCVAVGHPLGYQEGRPPVVRVGRVLRVQEQQIQTDCPLVAGDSGGPLFDLAGKVIGINSRIGGSTDMNYHIPVDVYERNWKRLAKSEFWEEPLPRKENAGLGVVLGQITANAARCVVRVECNGNEAALGTIVGSDGWILTKASELCGPAVCRLSDGRRYPARLVGVDKHFDLAMLKIAAVGLPSIPWSVRVESAVGQWVAALGLLGQPPALGVVSVPRRRIPPSRGVLGIGVGRAEAGALVVRVLSNTPAERAGLRENDIVTNIDGRQVSDREKFLEYLHDHVPGDVIKLVIRRGQSTLELAVTLDEVDTPASRKREIQNISDIGVSRRHDDFPMVLQHDTVLRPSDCGGPLVDLSGQVIGVNVARGGRTETYSVPTDVLLPLVEELKTGRLALPAEPVLAAQAAPEARLASAVRPQPQPTARHDEMTPREASSEPAAQP